MSEKHIPSAASVSRRKFLMQSSAAAAAIAFPMIAPRSALAATVINMLAWYGHGEPDVVGEFEAMHNVKFKP